MRKVKWLLNIRRSIGPKTEIYTEVDPKTTFFHAPYMASFLPPSFPLYVTVPFDMISILAALADKKCGFLHFLHKCEKMRSKHDQKMDPRLVEF